MSYDQARISEQMRLLQPARQRFVQNYRPDLPTIIFLPGGMASSLLQADQKYTGGSGPFAYNWALWISCCNQRFRSSAFGTKLLIRMSAH